MKPTFGDDQFEISLHALFRGQGVPWIIAGKRADPIQGSNVFLAACQRLPRKTAASRLSLGRTPPGPRLENAIRSAFFSRCQLPRPNCQRTKRADRTAWIRGTNGSCSVMDRGSSRPAMAHLAIHRPKRASTHGRDCHEPPRGNRSRARGDRPRGFKKISGRQGGRQAPEKIG